MKPILLLPLVVLPFLAGCSNVGDTNPVSPEKMEEIRNKTAQERGNFKPTERPPQ